MLTTWLAFLISLAAILIVSKKSLPAGLAAGAITLGFISLPVATVLERIAYTVTDPSVLVLAIAMGVIPMIGGAMKETGQIDSLVNNLRIPKSGLMASSAALMGLLPMPGGALLSAPILDRGGEGVPTILKATINNWFRHLFILIYPLAPALIVSTQICELDVYRAIIYLLPGFAFALILGYFFYLRRVRGRLSYREKFSASGLLIPLMIILSAPATDFVLKRLWSLGTPATLIGVAVGLTLSLAFSKRRINLGRIFADMRAWNFALIIIGMFLYLRIFEQSEARHLIATVPMPPLTLAITAGFLLGFVTGRVQLPASIIFPVYLTSIGGITPVAFALIYTSTYFGYIISPVHPCLVVTAEYFRIPVREMIIHMSAPTAIVFAAVLALSLVMI